MLSSQDKVIKKILKEIDFSQAKNFYDLGCGNGKVVSKIAKNFPSLECFGVEYNIVSYFLAKIRNIFLKRKFICKKEDFFKTDLKKADIIFVYLFPGIMKNLEVKFARELKVGAIVIANSFPLPNKKPAKQICKKNSELGVVYFYRY
jgi:SAM-dependent methyltransferase